MIDTILTITVKPLVFLMLIQEHKYIVPIVLDDYAQPPGTGGGKTAFDGYIEPLSSFILAAGAVLAIMSAYKIYKNAQLNNGNLFEGTVNIITGMIFLFIIHLWVIFMF